MLEVKFYDHIADEFLKFAVIISKFEEELHSEMEKVFFFDELPTKWTYPQIQPVLIAEYERRLTDSGFSS